MVDFGGHEHITQAQAHYLLNRDSIETVFRRLLARAHVPNYLDVAQDLTQKGFENCGTVSNETWASVTNHDGYIYRVVRNLVNTACYELLNRREESLDPTVIDQNSYGKSTQNTTEAQYSAIFLQEILRHLTAEERALVEMMFQEYTSREMAKELNLTHDAVRQRVFRLKKKLVQLTKDGGHGRRS
jgi:RNA polymerase sigma factor (sigma-70 family)